MWPGRERAHSRFILVKCQSCQITPSEVTKKRGEWEGDVAILCGRNVCTSGRGSLGVARATHRAVANMLTVAVRQMLPVRLHIMETQHNKQASHKSQNSLKTQ